MRESDIGRQGEKETGSETDKDGESEREEEKREGNIGKEKGSEGKREIERHRV